jgi:hypothetical protein
MNLSEQIDRLRARLNERNVKDAFEDDADLIPLLNEGARYVAKKMAAINRRVNIVTDCCDIIAYQDRYPAPADFLFEMDVWFGPEPQNPQDPTRERLVCVEPNRGKRGYYMDGMWINLTFAPPEDILCGLKIRHCAAIAMIDEGDIPPIPSDLHMAIVVAAERFAVPQVGEAATQQLAELMDLLGDLPAYYKQENAEQPVISARGLQYGQYGQGTYGRGKYGRSRYR